jgi:hypothetical protein
MSISALSSNLIADLSEQRQNPFQEIKQDFQQLASALQSGDLSGAQSAYSAIQQVLGANSGSTSNSSSSGPNTLQTDFAALGQALQSGDLSTAQSAFSQLQSDSQAARQSRFDSSQTSGQGQDQYVSSASQGQNPIEEAIQDYTQLASDLQSGNLTGAQSAYSDLQQLIQANAGSSTSGTSSNTSTIQTDFATLGDDLSAGNLTESQSAFSQLQTDLQAPTPPPAVSTTPTQNPVQQVQQDYLQLSSALQSGNLTGAQTAFAALEQALQTQSGTSAAATTTSGNSNDPIANDLSALGQALSSGNLTQAQSAFTQLNSDIQTAEQSGQNQDSPQGFKADERHHHHHGWDGNSNSGASSYTSSNSSSSVNVYA